MGRKLTVEEHINILEWGKNFEATNEFIVKSNPGKTLRNYAEQELSNYWKLSALSRLKERRFELSKIAEKRIFSVRKRIESSLSDKLHEALNSSRISPLDLIEGNFFGSSIKQGISLRMPLTTCNPTKDCQSGCYAHDGMDAGKNAVVKGVLNGTLAECYEREGNSERKKITNGLKYSIRSAIKAARRESKNSGFSRKPRIRFSHVGEIVQFPEFSNQIALMVKNESGGDVVCTVYTRHKNAQLLDPSLFVINFTIDRTSYDRLEWAPSESRIMYSAWDGILSSEAEINFIEHHRFSHCKPSGSGQICPATLPDAEVRTCDALKCQKCFIPKNHPSC